MPKPIHIKIADRGWILEKCAREIAERASNITYGTDPDASADLQYYINYSARSRRVSPVEIAFFTHSEKDPAARQRYFDCAKDVDHCVCMSERYAKELVEAGIPADKVTTIAPGVDLDEFRPKVRIGVVGRTYHTGRKGEALVAEVMDVPGIEWRFTGSGWPGASTHVPDGRMADFYNDLDYVLVPALYEGGPMSVLEGLACGVPVISSDVGWAPEYPHIPFETGNAQSLRDVLSGLVAEREALRSSVKDRTWDKWAEAHVELFGKLLGANAKRSSAAEKSEHRVRATLVIHSESKSLGGPSVRVPRTASELSKIGVAASMPHEHPDNFDDSDLTHLFNVWPADSCFKVLDRARSVGRRTVLSPIFLNLANMPIASSTLPRLFSTGQSASEIDGALAEIARQVAEEPNLPTREPFDGYHERVRVCVNVADHVIFLSEYERRCLESIGANPRSASLVHNPVDAAAFANADPGAFGSQFGLDEYILCVGRIEPRKNQLVLAHAARALDVPMVFVGHTENKPYYDLVRAAAGPSAHFIPRIDPGDPLLRSAYAGATVFCLPSWAEGAPLAALEAAAAGAPLVLSDRSSEQEYFGDFAYYVNPADVAGMREAIRSAAAQRSDEKRRDALRHHVEENFSWQKYATATSAAYDEAIQQPVMSAPKSSGVPEKIYFDLTTSCHNSGNPTGIARVEQRALRALLAEYGDRIVPIAWNSRTKNYVELSRATAMVGVDLAELERLERLGDAPVLTRSGISGGRILVLGGAWIRNTEFIGALHALKLSMRANLSVLVHDLIQMRLAHMYPDGVGELFADNARQLLQITDDFLVYSESTLADLREFLAENNAFYRKISRFRLGDISALHERHADDEGIAQSAYQQRFSGKRFALYVSSIEIRKNHALLINVWRRLIEERGSATPHLIFVGRPLWRGKEIVESITRDEKLRQFVHVLEDVDDRDLDWFYRNCDFTLYPSLYEGWGLPVAESLSYGKMCIASDRTSTREVAPEITDLLDPYDFRAWHDRVAFYFDNPTALEKAEARIASKYKEYPWSDAVREIVSIIDSVTPAAVKPAFLFPGEHAEFRAGAASGAAVCAGGWSNPERAGRWSVGASSRLAFRYPAKSGQIQLRLRLHALARPGHSTRSFRVRINDQVDEIMEISSSPSLLDLTIPVTSNEGAAYSSNEIIFEPIDLFSPGMISTSADTRLLGVYLVAAQVADSVAELSQLPPPAPPAPARQAAAKAPDTLVAAKQLVVLPSRFTGKRPFARVARAVGFDKLWLRMHRRQFRRAYQSIGLIIDHLQAQKR